MGIFKDATTKTWQYKFETEKRSYAARGFKTRREAEAARVERRKEVKSPADSGFQNTEDRHGI